MPADFLQKQGRGADGGLFRKGRSGNPAGRRPGCGNRATLGSMVQESAGQRPRDPPRRLGGHIADRVVDPPHLVDGPGRDATEELVGEGVVVGGHAVGLP